MVSRCYLVFFVCFMYLFISYLVTNLLNQCQVPVLVFPCFWLFSDLILERSPNGIKSPKWFFFRTEEVQGAFGPSQVGSRDPTSPHSVTRGEAAVGMLVASPGGLCLGSHVPCVSFVRKKSFRKFYSDWTPFKILLWKGSKTRKKQELALDTKLIS